MNTPEYNPKGRKLTFEQHMKLRREWEEEQAKKVDKPTGEKSGYCSKCGQPKFSLRVEKGILYRTCKNCGDVKTF